MKNRQEYEKEGRRAEKRVASYLKRRGYSILAERFKTRYGEVDIIARKGPVIAFVEVKQRSTQKAIDESITSQSFAPIIRYIFIT